jgi:hypothetical protein
MGLDEGTEVFPRGDLNCAAALEERTSDLLFVWAPGGASCALTIMLLYLAGGSLMIRSCRASSRGVGVASGVDVGLICNGERKGAASFLRESF